jgi:hypothetical protein
MTTLSPSAKEAVTRPEIFNYDAKSVTGRKETT